MAKSKRTDAKLPARLKLNVSLDADVARRLKAMASYRGVDACAIVSAAIERELVGFVVYERGQAATSPSEPLPAPAGDSVHRNGVRLANGV